MNVEKAIWSAYIANPCRLYSIRELALSLHKSYPLIHQHVSRLLSEKKLISKTVGKSILCHPHYLHPLTILSLAIAEANNTISASQNDSSLLPLYSFFSNQIFQGVLSVFLTSKELVIVLSNKTHKKEVDIALSKTTLDFPLIFLLQEEVSLNIDVLVNKKYVLYGYEQFHTLIRNNYDLYASKHNLVKLHE